MTAFEQPPTSEPVSFDPPPPPARRRGTGIWILAVAGLVVVGGAAVALIADDDSGSAASADEPTADAPQPSPTGDDTGRAEPGERGDSPDRDDEDRDEDRDRPTDERGDRDDDRGDTAGEPDGEQEREDRDVSGQIVIDDGDGRTVIDLDDLDPGALLECMGWSMEPGRPPLGDLGPLFDEFDFDELERGDLGPLFDQFDEFDFDKLERGDLGPLFDQFDLEQLDPDQFEVDPSELEDVDLEAMLAELGVEDLEDLDLDTLLELFRRLGLGPVFGEFGPAQGGPGWSSRGLWFGQSDDDGPVVPPLPGRIEDCLPLEPSE